MKLKIMMTTLACLNLVACAHTPSKGEMMLGVSEQAKELSTQWEGGEKMIASGQAQQSKGQKLIRNGESQIADGKNLISKGNDNVSSGEDMVSEGKAQVAKGLELKQQSESSFNNKFSDHDISDTTKTESNNN